MAKKKTKTVKTIQRTSTYTRISDDANNYDDKGVRKRDCTVEVQKKKNRDEVEYMNRRGIKKYVLKPEHEFCDDGYSGATTNRPAFQQLCAIIENEEVDVVVASELSRLSRTVKDFLEFVELCNEHRVDLVIIGMNLDTSSEIGKLFMTFMVALAEFERNMTGLRVKSNARARLLSDGKINGASEILGLICDPNCKGHFIRHDGDLKKAAAILNLYLEHPSREAVYKAVENDEKMVNYKDKKITRSMAESVLKHAKWRYRGLWYANKENEHSDPEALPENLRYQMVKLRHGPVIDIALLDKVVAKLEDTKKTHKKTGAANYTYFLSDILFDEEGNHFKADSSKKKDNSRYRYRKISRKMSHLFFKRPDFLTFDRHFLTPSLG